jgi:hypothetical protein
MAAAGKGIPPARKNPANEHPLTVMVMGKVGKVRSFRLSRRLFFLALLFFAAYLPISAYLVNRYFDLSRTNEHQRVRIERFEQDLLLSTNALSRSREHILFLEDYISQMETRAERASQPATSRVKRAEGVAAAPPDTNALEKEAAIVAVEDLVMEIKGDILLIHFKIVKLLSGDNSVGGYVHLAAKDEAGSIRPEWISPQLKWVDGFPEDFRQGQMFLIQRFKPIEGRLPLGEGPDAPTMLEILVYDDAGGIMLQKGFKIP